MVSPFSTPLQSQKTPFPPKRLFVRTSIAAVVKHCWRDTEGTGATDGGSVTGFAVGGISVGALDTAEIGASVGSCTGKLDGSSETNRTSVDDCAIGASLQMSLPPITDSGAMAEHCCALCDGYPEFANVLPATSSRRAVIPTLSRHSPQPLTSPQLAVM